MARHSNSMYPAALDATHSLEDREREPLLGPRADRQGPCSPNTHGAGGLIESLAGFQSRETGKSACVEASCVEGMWGVDIMYPLARSRLCN